MPVTIPVAISAAIPAGSYWRRDGFQLCTPTHHYWYSVTSAARSCPVHAAVYLRVSIALAYGHNIRRMSVEEKFREYKLVPDVLRVAPSEKAEVSLPWT